MSTGERVALTRAEELLLERRRLGESQTRAAQRHGVTYQMYGAWETGKVTTGLPKVSLNAIRPYERALIYRRRAGVSQADVALELGCCPFTVRKMERGLVPCDDLLAYWEA